MKAKMCFLPLLRRSTGSGKTPIRQNPTGAGRARAGIFFSALAGLLCAASVNATPVRHNISAANLNVQQIDTGNTSTSIVVTASLAINGFNPLTGSKSSSRADYYVQIGTNATDNVTNGILMSCIDENGRDNGEGDPFTGINYGTSAIDSGPTSNPGASGQWWIPVFQAPQNAEYNFNVAAAYFRYADGWYGGWLNNATGANGGANNHFIGNTNIVLGVNVIDLGGGKTTVDLRQFGLDARTNAILLVVGGKNEANYAESAPNTNGTWTVFCHDDNAQGGSYEQDYIAFVCVPLTNHLIVSGRFNGDCSIAMQSAPFFVTNTYAGTYHLAIPGATPGNGVLIISAEGAGPYNIDNIVSYQATADGWDIQTRDLNKNALPSLQTLTASDAVVSFVYIPAPTAGFTVTPTNGLVTGENGAAATFTVTLDAPPTADVTVGLASSNPTQGVASPASLTFNAANWNVPQTVTVTGVADTVADGGLQPYTVDFTPAVSDDTNYDGLQPASVSLVNADSDQPGITVWPTNGLVTTESGGAATFYVFLNSPPTGDVTIGLASSQPGEGVPSASSLVFNGDNWNVPQAVTVTGVDDGVVDSDIAYYILTAPAVSDDANYNGMDAADVSAVNLDNDVAGVSVSVGNSISVIEGNATNFTVTLAAQPLTDVTITYVSSNPDAGIVSPATLTFTPENWNAPQTVTLTGVDNSANDGNVRYHLSATVNSTSPGYATLVLPDLNATTLEKTSITLPSGDCVFGLGMTPVALDGGATVADSSASSFNGASLTVALTANADAADTLGIRNVGTDAGQISVAGNTVSYGGSAIGTFTGGNGATPLVVTLQNGATIDAVQALVRAITFSAGSTTAFAPRTALITLNDGLGGVVSAGKNIRVGLLRVTQFQNGADFGYGTYDAEADIELEQANPNTPYPAGGDPASGLFVDAPVPGTPNECQVLLRFDDLIGTNANQIPPGAIIVAADLNINIINSGNGGMLNRMLIPWDATNDTWNSFMDSYGDTGVFADDITARAAFDSQLGVSILNPETGTISGGTTGTGNVSFSVTPDIQAWADGEANYGWFFHGWNQETDGMGFSPAEDPVVQNRPRLRVYWLPRGTASASFRYGVNDYTNVYDAEILQGSPATSTPAGLTIWSDATDVGEADATEALIRFDNLVGTGANQIPPGARIEAAMLDLASVNSTAAMGDGGQFFALLQPWQDTDTTWNAWGVNGIQNDGIQAAVTPTITAGSPTLSPNVQAGFHSFEVTADVQSWVDGTRPNYGWAILPWPGGSDGWGIDTSEDSVEINRPQLRVYYTAASGTLRARLLPLTVSPAQVRVKFTGSAGGVYTIERAAALDGTWTPIGSITVGDDGTATFMDNAPLSGAAFYRVSNSN
jgi:hypothetical protein